MQTEVSSPCAGWAGLQVLAGVQKRAWRGRRAEPGVGLGVTQSVDRMSPGPLELPPSEEAERALLCIPEFGLLSSNSVGKLWPDAQRPFTAEVVATATQPADQAEGTWCGSRLPPPTGVSAGAPVPAE